MAEPESGKESEQCDAHGGVSDEGRKRSSTLRYYYSSQRFSSPLSNHDLSLSPISKSTSESDAFKPNISSPASVGAR